MTSLNELLEQRGKEHGDFTNVAVIACRIKMITRGQNLTDVQREVIDMIATKLGRICSGGNMNKDNWDDIAGYATLAARRPENELDVGVANSLPFVAVHRGVLCPVSLSSLPPTAISTGLATSCQS